MSVQFFVLLCVMLHCLSLFYAMLQSLVQCSLLYVHFTQSYCDQLSLCI